MTQDVLQSIPPGGIALVDISKRFGASRCLAQTLRMLSANRTIVLVEDNGVAMAKHATPELLASIPPKVSTEQGISFPKARRYK